MMGKVADHVGVDCDETPDPQFVAKPVDDCHFPWEAAVFVENTITFDSDEGFSTQ